MDANTLVHRANDLSRRRARTLPGLVVLYLSQQVGYFGGAEQAGPALGPRAGDPVRTGAWVVLSLLLLAAVATKGFWWYGRDLRDLIDDEVTRASRLDALRWGYLTAVGAAVALYSLDQIQPLTTREALHTVVSLALGVAVLRFAMLERRAHCG